MSTLTKIAFSNDKKNKTRSILIMCSICLTTMLLMTISTMGNGLIRMQKKDAALDYGKFYGIYASVNEIQLRELKRRAEIAEIGILHDAGILKGNEKGIFASMDEMVREMLPKGQGFSELKEGNFPIKKDDIVASKAFFKSQGYHQVKIGDKVSLSYRSGMKEKFKWQDFVISGILSEPAKQPTKSVYEVYCSSSFYESHFQESERVCNVYFTLDESVEVSMDSIETMLKNIAKSCGIDKDKMLVNKPYLTWILEPSYDVIVLCIILIVGIVLFSVVVIYNIFQVGIAQKIQEYGKIKALGATQKQMKKLIFREGILLTIPSIPIGLLLGFGLAKQSLGFLIKQSNSLMTEQTNSQVPLFSFAMMFASVAASFITVILALRRPMKLVARISPIEATRYLENVTKKNCGIRKGKRSVTVFSLAKAHVTGNKKGTIGTVLTMGLSCVLFVIISNFVGNFDAEYEARKNVPQGQFMLELDYPYEWDEAYPENNLDYILKNNPLNDSLIANIKGIAGVKGVSTQEIAVVNVNHTKKVASIVNKEDFERMRHERDLGAMDYDQAVKSGDIFWGWLLSMESYGFKVDQPVSLELDNGTKKMNYKGKIAGAFINGNKDWVIPEKVYQSLKPEGVSYGYMWVDCDDKDVKYVEQKLEEYLSNLSNVEMFSYQEQLRLAEFESRVMKLGCYLLMAIVGLIGFLNLANTMIINITTKKQEYGVLQAVGMTNKQLNMALQMQGLIFTVGTICIALLAGLPLGYMLFRYAKKKVIFGMNVYHVPVVPITAMILVIAVLQIVLSCILSHNLKKETLVERIRYQG